MDIHEQDIEELIRKDAAEVRRPASPLLGEELVRDHDGTVPRPSTGFWSTTGYDSFKPPTPWSPDDTGGYTWR